MYSLIRGINKFFKMGMYDYCQLEANDDGDNNHTFLSKKGHLITYIDISGTTQMVGAKRFDSLMESLYDGLSGVFRAPGHKLEMVYYRDPDASKIGFERSIKGMRETAEILDLDLGAIIDEREEKLGQVTSHERTYLVVTTMPGILTPNSLKAARKEQIEDAKKLGIGVKPGEFGQSPYGVIKEIRDIHDGFLDRVVDALRIITQYRVLNCHEAMFSLRKEIYPEGTSLDWKPSLIGDPVRPRLNNETPLEFDISHIMNSSIAYQLFTKKPAINAEDSTIAEMGSRKYAPVMVDLPPEKPKKFRELFGSIDRTIPWRMSMVIESGHKSVCGKVASKKTAATFLALTSEENKKIKASAESLLEMADDGEIMAACSISFTTWADDLKLVKKRKEILSQSIQSWGSMDVIDDCGDAIEAWCNTLPGLSENKVAVKIAWPLKWALMMTPFGRPTSAFEVGSMLYTTPDGKIFPIAPGSNKQNTWFSLSYAPPGYGKSFKSSADNLSYLLNPGNIILPRLCIIDVGFSSSSFVDMIREALPAHKKHLALSFKMVNSTKMAINPFDTPLGCRKPTSFDRSFLVNFLSMVLTPAGSKGVERLGEVVGFIIDEMYEYFSDENQPEVYEVGYDDEVDKKLSELGFTAGNERTWWQAVDTLFRGNSLELAERAQRFAVPTLSSATSVVSNSRVIRDTFKDSQISGESLISYVNSMIMSAIKDYPILSQPTVFSIASARVVSCDIKPVLGGQSDQGVKQTGIMYMLARNILTRSFFFDPDIVLEMPREYQEHHLNIINQDKVVHAKLVMDEFHETSNAGGYVQEQAKNDGRHGRKYGVEVDLLSQFLNDYDEEMIKLATNIYFLSKGNSEDDIKEIVNRFGISSDAMVGLKRFVNGPGKQGTSMLVRSTTKGGNDVEQIIRLTLGPTELWAYNTGKEDYALKRELISGMGINRALKALKSEFPSGTALDYLKARAQAEMLDMESEGNTNIYKIVANEIIQRYAKTDNI